jgi:hypothetical protein
MQGPRQQAEHPASRRHGQKQKARRGAAYAGPLVELYVLGIEMRDVAGELEEVLLTIKSFNYFSIRYSSTALSREEGKVPIFG